MSKPKAIVTSGPTREYIDPVRYITNESSGKQGYAIAKALLERGYDVDLISGPVSIIAPEGANLISVSTADEMLVACKNSLPAEIIFCVAAVCDWKPEKKHSQKLKKKAGINNLKINFIKNPDILAQICKEKERPEIVVGFAAETENLLENAANKLASKGCDYIIANNVSCGFGSDQNSVTILNKNGIIANFEDKSKEHIADEIIKLIAPA